MVTIDVLNAGKDLHDQQVLRAVMAAQKTIAFRPEPWSVTVRLNFVPRGGKLAPGHWLVGVFDGEDRVAAFVASDPESAERMLGKVVSKSGDVIDSMLTQVLLKLLSSRMDG